MPDNPRPNEQSLFSKLSSLLSRESNHPQEIRSVLTDAFRRKLIDPETYSMIEGIFRMQTQTVREIMVPSTQINFVDISRDTSDWIKDIIESGHSRYPVIDGDPEKIVGVLHAKALLKFPKKKFDVRKILRPAVFIPESKPVRMLLHDFRISRNHLALVVDEFGSVSGLVTIEDVLEQIVGDIQDEFDDVEAQAPIVPVTDGETECWRVDARTPITQFNRELGVSIPRDRIDTIGGYVAMSLGRIPAAGEQIELDGLMFDITEADTLQIGSMLVSRSQVPNKKTP